MSGAKKNSVAFDDQVNEKIQRKFDLVFNEQVTSVPSAKNTSDSAIFNNDEIDIQFGSDSQEEFVMEKKGSSAQINLDFSLDEDALEVPQASVTPDAGNDDGLDFSLNFDLDAVNEEVKPTESLKANNKDISAGFSLDEMDFSPEVEIDEATKKTIMLDSNEFKADLDNLSLDDTSGMSSGSADHMSKEESRANIESTIKDILRPKIEDTKEIDLAGLEMSAGSPLDEIEDSELAFRDNTPSKGFALNEMSDDDFAIEVSGTKSKVTPPISKISVPMSNESTGEFDIGSIDTAFNVDDEEVAPVFKSSKAETLSEISPSVASLVTPPHVAAQVSQDVYQPSMGMGGSNITSEDGMRFQATIRALREEREGMLQQIKNLKTDSKELEQDNLTLKANLDEAKIEITILRKRQMVELEDIKYRLTMSEEKKAIADEKARQADMRREKLEQKVRIDFNQVKQREKELESKLELLSMDVDSQVQSRDHKILELRRKIDALEFNMENATIKEQKSLDDKRKLEDRLNKIMKTLRHSIKNLEDDIDHAQEDDHHKEKN